VLMFCVSHATLNDAMAERSQPARSERLLRPR